MSSSPLSPRVFVHRIFTAFVIAVVLTVVLIAGAYSEAASKVAKIAKAQIDPAVLESGGNYLLIGSDSRAFVKNDPAAAQHFGSAQTQTGQRSDTIMVAHVDAAAGTAYLVSFPRDLWVAIPGMGNAKINAAFNAGPQRVIKTIEDDFDVPISHYLEIDFEGFRKMVNELGTIPINFATPARDIKSGLDIKQAGCNNLTGDQALAYVRSRYYESYVDGQWKTDPLSDLSRIQRQQYFLRTLAQKTLHTAATSPWKANGLLDSMLSNLVRDPKLGLSSLRALAYAFHRPDGVVTATLPTNRHFFDGQDALAIDEVKAAPMLARLRGIGDTSPKKSGSGSGSGSGSQSATAGAGTVHVSVQNGSGRTGLGARAADALGGLGFSVVGTATNADRGDYRVTEVRYATGHKAQGQTLLAALGGAGKLVSLSGSAPAGANVVLVLGLDYKGLSRPTATTPKSSGSTGAKTPSSAAAGGGTSGSTVAPTGC